MALRNELYPSCGPSINPFRVDRTFARAIETLQISKGRELLPDGTMRWPFEQFLDISGAADIWKDGMPLAHHHQLGDAVLQMNELVGVDPYTRGSALESVLVLPYGENIRYNKRLDGYNLWANPEKLLHPLAALKNELYYLRHRRSGAPFYDTLQNLFSDKFFTELLDQGANLHNNRRNMDIYWSLGRGDYNKKALSFVEKMRKISKQMKYGMKTKPGLTVDIPDPNRQLLICRFTRWDQTMNSGVNFILKGQDYDTTTDLHKRTISRLHARAQIQKTNEGLYVVLDPKNYNLIATEEGTSVDLDPGNPNKHLKLSKYIRTAVCYPSNPYFLPKITADNIAIRLKASAEKSNPRNMSSADQAATTWNYASAFLQNPIAVYLFVGEMLQRGVNIFPNINTQILHNNIGEIIRLLANPRVIRSATNDTRYLDSLPNLLGSHPEIARKCKLLTGITGKLDALPWTELEATDPGWRNPFEAVALASCFAPQPLYEF